MHCKYCQKPAVRGGYPDTYFCESCQRILTPDDIYPDPVEPPPRRNFDEMEPLSLEKPQPTAQPAPQQPAPQDAYHKVCRVCKSRVDHSGDGSYYCPQCGMFKDENGVELSGEQIVPRQTPFSQSHGANSSTSKSFTPSSEQGKASLSQILEIGKLAFFTVFSAIIPAIGGEFTIVPVITAVVTWMKYAKLPAPRSPAALVLALVATVVLAFCALNHFFIPFTPGYYGY